MTKLTKFIFFRNTPLVDFQNTIHFSSNEERDDFFITNPHYPTYQVNGKNFNYIRDKSTITMEMPYQDLLGYNYGTFESDFEPGKRYYFFILNYEYINDNATRIYMLIDPIMTYTQGDVLTQLKNLDIDREHLRYITYKDNLRYLKNNDDVLKTYSKRYIMTKNDLFNKFDIIFQCKVDLTKDFGTEKAPNMETSKGVTYDKITSPVNLYRVEKDNFTQMMESLSKYPWISQNITKVLLIPSIFFDLGSFKQVTLWCEQDKRTTDLYQFLNNQWSKNYDAGKINMTMDELLTAFDLNVYEEHLLRNEYFTAEINIWNGQQLNIDLGKLNSNTGIQVLTKVVLGYNNEISFYLKNYNSDTTGSDSKNVDPGSFLNDSVTMNNWDEVPILIDEYQLAKAKSANQRQLAESRLLTNRVNNVMNGNNLQTRFMDAVSLTSNLSPSNLFGKFTDEYEFYRNQQAQFKDLKLTSPETTNQTTPNSLAIANDYFGISLKLSKPIQAEERRIKKYYKSFGYEMNIKNGQLDDVHSMSIANYFKFKGSWTIPNIDVGFMEQMRAQFENGVRFWHNNGTANPMTQDLINNKVIS